MNVRVVLTGVVMIVLALGFYFVMGVALAPKSNDPAAMMQTVGTVSGAVGGLGLAMTVIGTLRKKQR